METSTTLRRGVIGVIRRHDRLLVICRARDIAAGGWFCFPGGGMEAGELEQQALARELHEEIGAIAHPHRRLWQSVTPSGVQLAWWHAELITPAHLLRPNPTEVASVHWLTVQGMRQLPRLLPSNRRFLEIWSHQECR